MERSDATIHTRYFHKDHLGSIATITDHAGVVVERLSYDAWGKRRHANGEDDPTGSIASQTSRGFTGHEVLDQVGLVHMNGRVYDPMLGRFGTPDPMTEDPYSTQGWNRYTYVGNSPVNFTDPSGYCFMGCFWQKPFKALGALLRRIPILGQLVQIAAVALCGPGAPVCAVAAAGISAAVTTGLASGDLGMALKAGFIATATALAFQGVGDLTGGIQGAVPNAMVVTQLPRGRPRMLSISPVTLRLVALHQSHRVANVRLERYLVSSALPQGQYLLTLGLATTSSSMLRSVG